MLLLMPTDGGLSFRLFRFADQPAAAAFLAALASPIDPQPRHIAFRALSPAERPLSDGAPLEAVVLIRDARRPGIVDLYSFVDMEGAKAYVKQESVAELDPELVMVFWAQPVDLTAPEPQESAPAPASEPPPPPIAIPVDLTASEPQESAPAPSREPAPPPIAIPVPPRPAQQVSPSMQTTERRAPPVCPTEPIPQPQMTSPAAQVRVGVTPAGASFESAEARRAEGNRHAPAVRTGIVAHVQAWGGWDGLAPLLVRAAVGNESAYREFDEDPYAAGRGRLVIGLALVATAVGALGSGLGSVLVHVPAFALGWAALAFTIYAMGTQAFPGRRSPQTLPRLFRVLGLATAPALLLVMGMVPTYGPLFVLVAYIWMLITTATAVAGPLELNRDSSIVVATTGCLVLFTVSQVIPLLLT